MAMTLEASPLHTVMPHSATLTSSSQKYQNVYAGNVLVFPQKLDFKGS